MKYLNKFCLSDSVRKMGILFLMLNLFLISLFSQQVIIQGIVSDEFGYPASGVNVVQKGTANGTVTGMDGTYSITVSDAQLATLQFSFVGYATKEEAVL